MNLELLGVSALLTLITWIVFPIMIFLYFKLFNFKWMNEDTKHFMLAMIGALIPFVNIGVLFGSMLVLVGTLGHKLINFMLSDFGVKSNAVQRLTEIINKHIFNKIDNT